MDYSNKKKKSFNFKEKKDCALKSIYEINCFLCGLNNAFILKKIIKRK